VVICFVTESGVLSQEQASHLAKLQSELSELTQKQKLYFRFSLRNPQKSAHLKHKGHNFKHLTL
jgi:hypothetical protein